jgi:hypothetical protein
VQGMWFSDVRLEGSERDARRIPRPRTAALDSTTFAYRQRANRHLNRIASAVQFLVAVVQLTLYLQLISHPRMVRPYCATSSRQ